MSQRTFNWPINPTTVNSGPIQIEVSGVPQVVDPVTGIFLPEQIYDASGVKINPATKEGVQSVKDAIDAVDFATETTLQSVASSLSALNAKDFATQTTLAALAAKDFATETTLSGMNSKIATTVNGLKVDGSAVIQPVSASSLPLPTGAATAANQSTANTTLSSIDSKLAGVATAANQSAEQTLIGAVTETAPASDTASSGLNGRLQRVAQRITSLIGLLPTSLGTKTSANSLAVVLPSDQATIPVTQVATTGSFAQITNLVNTAQTFTAPANAIGFKLQAPSTNTENISFSIGSTATITAGILMEPGRSEDFDTGSNISVIATSATQQVVNVLWRVKP